jgi:hypothetical protein
MAVEVVVFRDEPFFAQRAGSTYFLYRRRVDVGTKALATYSTTRAALRHGNAHQALTLIGKGETAREAALVIALLSERVTNAALAERLSDIEKKKNKD